MARTDERGSAEWDLKMLTVSDPAAMRNVMRHAVALSLMLTGRRQRAKRDGEPEIASCFRLSSDDSAFLARVTAQTGIDQIMMSFDVDDACGSPLGIAIVHHDGDGVGSYDDCKLWSPANDGHAVLVPSGTQDFGYFAHRAGGSLRHVDGQPAADLESGYRRARRRMAKLLASPEVLAAENEGFGHVLSSSAGVITDRVMRLAA